MDHNFEFLIEKEEMWAKMLMEVLEDNGIPCTSFPVHGAAFSFRTGMGERLKVYVPADKMAQARELLEELFSGEPIYE